MNSSATSKTERWAELCKRFDRIERELAELDGRLTMQRKLIDKLAVAADQAGRALQGIGPRDA